MDNQTCVSCQERLHCGDSPLSITGNTIGLLTFIGALWVGIQVYVNSMWNSRKKIERTYYFLTEDTNEARHLIRLVRAHHKNLDRDQMERLETALILQAGVLREYEPLLREFEASRRNAENWSWRRAKLILKEDKVEKALAWMKKGRKTLREVDRELFAETAAASARHHLALCESISRGLAELREDVVDLKKARAEDLGVVRESLQEPIERSTPNIV